MTYEKAPPVEATAYKWRENGENYVYRGIELPCDVRIPPATVIRAGCSLDTLLSALSLPGRPRNFGDAA